MLISKIREKVAWLVGLIALAIISFLLMDAFDDQHGIFGRNNNKFGTVDDLDLSQLEYEKRVEQITRNYQSSQREIDEPTRYQIREQAWNQYVQDMLAQEEYAKLGINVGDSELENMLLSEKEPHPSLKNTAIFQDESGNFSRAKFAEYIRSFGDGTPEAEQRRAQWSAFEKSIIETEERSKYTNLIKKAVYVPKWQVEFDNANKTQSADIKYVFAPYTTVQDSEISVTDSDLSSYLSRNASQFKQKEGRIIEYVTFAVRPSAADSAQVLKSVADVVGAFKTTADPEEFLKLQFSATPFAPRYYTQSELTTSVKDSLFSGSIGSVYGPFYESGQYKAIRLLDRRAVADSAKVRIIAKVANQTTSPDAIKKTIDSLNTVIDKGTSFEEVAKANTDDPSTKEKGGDLGYIKAGSLSPKLDEGIFYSSRGKGSRFVVKDETAAYIVEITDISGSKEAVKVAVLSKNVEPGKSSIDAAYQKATEYAANNRTVEAFRAAAVPAGVQIRTSPSLKKSDYSLEGLGIASDIIAWAYKNKANSISERVFQVDSDLPDGRTQTNYAVVALTGVQEEGTAKVEDVRAKLEAAVKNEKKAAKIKEKLQGATTLDAAASATGQTVKDGTGITFTNATSVAELSNEPKIYAAAVGLAANAVSKPLVGDRGVAVVQVVSVTPPTAADPSVQRSMLQSLRNTAEYSAVNALVKAAKVEDNRLLLTR